MRDVTLLSWLAIAAAALTSISDIATAATASSAVAAYDRAIGVDPRDLFTTHDLTRQFGLATLAPMWLLTSIWLLRVHANADLISPADGRRSARWAWLGWAIPIASLWIPKEVIDESWHTTAAALAPNSARSRVRSTALWWGLWVSYQILGTLGGRVWVHGTDPHRGISPPIEIATAVLSVLALTTWITVVRRVTAVQSELVRIGHLSIGHTSP